jgi:hypothetical protein
MFNLAVVPVLILGCGSHKSEPDPELIHESGSVDLEQRADIHPPPSTVERRVGPQPRSGTVQTRALLGGPASGSAAYFHRTTGVYRLDASGWTQIWAEAVDRLLYGADGEIYFVDRSGVHRLRGEELITVWVADEHDASRPLYDVVDMLEVGPEGELWELRWARRRWTVSRIEPNGTKVSWEDQSVTGLNDPLAMVVDGKGRAWFIPEDPNGPIVYKQPDQDWSRIESWQRTDPPDRSLAAAPATGSEGGVLVLTTRELLRVRSDGVIERVALPSRGLRPTPDLAVNRNGFAVVRDAACNIDSYELARLTTPPKHISQGDGHCDEESIFFALDDRGRSWLRASEQSAIVRDSAGREAALPRLDTDTGDLVNVIVVGPGPELPADGTDAQPRAQP